MDAFQGAENDIIIVASTRTERLGFIVRREKKKRRSFVWSIDCSPVMRPKMKTLFFGGGGFAQTLLVCRVRCVVVVASPARQPHFFTEVLSLEERETPRRPSD